jgi:2,4-dichlorophenol 6-monooxygenase
MPWASSSRVSPEEGWARVQRLWDADPAHDEYRASVRRALASQSMEFREHNVEYGYTYSSNAVVDDGTPAPTSPDPVRIYQPSTRPGSPLPHAWLDTVDGGRVSTLDLVRPGRFLLIVGDQGDGWADAARALAEASHLPLDVAHIGHIDGHLLDAHCRWLRVRGIDEAGAILVRPDRFVAWRSVGGSDNPHTDLAAALGAVLQQDLSA